MNMGWEVVTSLLQVPWNGERGRQLLDNIYLRSHSPLLSGRTWRAGLVDHLVRSLRSTHSVGSSVLLQEMYTSGLTLIGRCPRIPLIDITNIHVVQLPRVPVPDSRSHTHTSTDKVQHLNPCDIPSPTQEDGQTALSTPGHGDRLGGHPELEHHVHPHISVQRRLKSA